MEVIYSNLDNISGTSTLRKYGHWAQLFPRHIFSGNSYSERSANSRPQNVKSDAFSNSSRYTITSSPFLFFSQSLFVYTKQCRHFERSWFPPFCPLSHPLYAFPSHWEYTMIVFHRPKLARKCPGPPGNAWVRNRRKLLSLTFMGAFFWLGKCCRFFQHTAFAALLFRLE